jgi:hypothetical protein
MSDPSGPSHFRELFEAAFRAYEIQTGKTVANHPLAEKLRSCDSVESVAAVLRGQTETSSKIRGKDKVLKQMLDRLTGDEARITAAETLEVVVAACVGWILSESARDERCKRKEGEGERQ